MTPTTRTSSRSHLAASLVVILAAAWQPAVGWAQAGNKLATEAARHQAQGNLDQALTLLTEALNDTRLPNDQRAAILTDRGAVLARSNQPKAAIDDFNRAVQLFPENPAVYNNRGSTLLTLGLDREAIKDFDRAIVLAPGYVAAYSNRANAKLMAGMVEGAVDDFSRAVLLDATSPAPLVGRARAHLAASRPNAAVRDLTHALAADSRLVLAYRLRAQAQFAADRIGEAIEDLSRAAAFDANNIDVYLERSRAYLRADNSGAALKDLARALEIDPNSVTALEARAVALVRLGASAEAEADIARALELTPRANLAIGARALLYLKTSQGELARREIERAVAAGPPRPDVMLIKGEIEETTGRREDAIRSYRAALAGRDAAREAYAGLTRVGGERADDVEIRGLGFESWRVVRRGARLVAISDEHTRISVPLETLTDSQPKLLDFEIMRPPNRDIAFLRYSPGHANLVHVAVLDIAQGQFLGVFPVRIGGREATWSFEDNKLRITAADGLADEFTLRTGGRGGAMAAAGAAAGAALRRPGDGPRAYAPPTWLPFGPPPQQQRRAQRQQPKTLFQFLFGN